MIQHVALIGAKGGTLKTASVAALAHVSAKAGLRIAMFDTDPQADLTSRSGFARVTDPLAAEPVRVHFEGEPEVELWLFRGGRSLEAADFETARRHLARAAEVNPDLVFIDTPPALGPLTTAAVREAALVIIPSMPGKESLERAHDVLTVVRNQPNPPRVRILLTMAHLQSNLFRWMQERVDEHYPGMRMQPVIPYEMPAGEAAIFELPVTVSAPRSKSARAYCDVAAEVLGLLRVERRSARPVGLAK